MFERVDVCGCFALQDIATEGKATKLAGNGGGEVRRSTTCSVLSQPAHMAHNDPLAKPTSSDAVLGVQLLGAISSRPLGSRLCGFRTIRQPPTASSVSSCFTTGGPDATCGGAAGGAPQPAAVRGCQGRCGSHGRQGLRLGTGEKLHSSCSCPFKTERAGVAVRGRD